MSTTPIAYTDNHVRCVPLVARAEASDNAPYPVPVGDNYVKFTGRVDKDARFIRAFSAVIDKAVALHDMRLFVHYGVIPEGTAVGRATESGLQLLYGWAPGVDQLFLDESVAIPLDRDMFYTLEVHYNFIPQAQPGVTNITDSSGLRVCFTDAQTQYPVSFTRLGTEDVAGSSATGMCTSRFFSSIELLALRPRMNARGRTATLSLHHGQAAEQVLYNAPFDFNEDGITAIGPRAIAPGDTLTSRCDYAESAHFGTGIDDEVCELYVLHWPAHSLVSNSRPGVPDACID
jgi:hypothetical protein